MSNSEIYPLKNLKLKKIDRNTQLVCRMNPFATAHRSMEMKPAYPGRQRAKYRMRAKRKRAQLLELAYMDIKGRGGARNRCSKNDTLCLLSEDDAGLLPDDSGVSDSDQETSKYAPTHAHRAHCMFP